MIVLALAGSVLSIDGSFIIIFISIFVLIFILNRTLFKPINEVLDERERLGAGRVAEARQLLVRYEEKLNGYEAELRAARSDAYQQLEAQRKEALALRQETVAAVKAEASKQVAAAQADLAKQAESARQNLESEARSMASSISSRILHRPVGAGGN